MNSNHHLNNAAGMISEHDVIRVMAGDVESARRRLIIALEEMGYRVISDDPLKARHAARGGARHYMSANVLEYPTTVEIGLKAQGATATRVTFDYQVIHGGLGEGDRQTLTREAEALVAVAATRQGQSSCVGCGAAVAADSRFCRKCGAPANISVPAELEVLRVTAGTRAGHQWNVIGSVILALTSVLPLIAVFARDFVTNPKGTKVLMMLAMVLGGLGWWTLLAGLRRTHLTLNPPDQKEDETERFLRRNSSMLNTSELPVYEESPAERLSITEGTTDLLVEKQHEREAVPARYREQ